MQVAIVMTGVDLLENNELSGARLRILTELMPVAAAAPDNKRATAMLDAALERSLGRPAGSA